MLKITEYAGHLLKDLDGLDWPKGIKEMQHNWIGWSKGVELEFYVLDNDGQEMKLKLTVFTTRVDTIFGTMYLVIAPKHPFLASITSDSQKIYGEDYFEKALGKSELERIYLQKDKSGVITSSCA